MTSEHHPADSPEPKPPNGHGSRSRRAWRLPVLLLILTALVAGGVATGRLQDAYSTLVHAQTTPFDMRNLTIPREAIVDGGPGKDGIPAITDPKFLPVDEVDYLEPDDMVVGYVDGDTARAYPHRILVYHEIVNDTVNGRPIVVTYCPLCGTSMIFGRTYQGNVLEFGVSGLLYKSDVLMYDRQTSSLWSQVKQEAVSGSMSGQHLDWLPMELMTWAGWQAQYPDSEVLSLDTGHPRPYNRQPYTRYFESDSTMFPVPFERTELRKKAWVVGVVLNGESKAYPLELLQSLDDEPLTDTVGGTSIRITYNESTQAPKVVRRDSGEPIPFLKAYWFAWQAFHPSTALYTRNQ